MNTGTVKFYNEEKGYGFITDEKTKKDIFIHASNLDEVYIEEGDDVTFETREGKKGTEAFNVNRIES